MSSFPQYRKLCNGKSLYKVISEIHLEELQQLGGRWQLHTVHATIMPERWLIRDVLQMKDGLYEQCDDSEFETIRQMV